MSTTVTTATTKDVTLKSVTVTLNDDQIKALPSTDIIIVPAQGENTAILMLDLSYSTNFVAPYTNISDATDGAYLYMAHDGYDLDEGLQNAPTGDTVLEDITQVLTSIGGWRYRYKVLPYKQAKEHSSLNNIAISTDCYNNAGNFTGGDPANTMKITVVYTVVDI